jgi:hypothetical protein
MISFPLPDNQEDNTLIWRCISDHPSSEQIKDAGQNSGVVDEPSRRLNIDRQ